MFIDEVDITVAGGQGGAGKVSFGKRKKSGPDGGNGGKGGDIYFESVNDIYALNQFSAQDELAAEDGVPGGRKKMKGANGKDLFIKIPIGTHVLNKETGETLFEMKKEGQRELVCVGGKGGLGNYEFRSPTNTTPKFAQKGLRGQKRKLKLVLKLIADFGLIGLPNAGKSSLLNELTNAKSKVANYPFTTLTPNLGALDDKIIADIPGLIKGASEGRGLGISFLKHIEKVGLLLHCISCESDNPLGDYKTIRKELENYNPKLSEKNEVIIITKTDLIDKRKINKLISTIKRVSKKVLPISIYDWDSIEKLKCYLLG